MRLTTVYTIFPLVSLLPLFTLLLSLFYLFFSLISSLLRSPELVFSTCLIQLILRTSTAPKVIFGGFWEVTSHSFLYNYGHTCPSSTLSQHSPVESLTPVPVISPHSSKAKMVGPGGGPPRKSHTKSRNGCKTCKRRHIRCDETFPQWYVLQAIPVYLY